MLFFPTLCAKSQQLVLDNFNDFPPNSHGLSLVFSHFQSRSVIFSHVPQSLPVTLTQPKTQELIDSRKVGKQRGITLAKLWPEWKLSVPTIAWAESPLLLRDAPEIWG